MTGKSDYNSGKTTAIDHDSGRHTGATANLISGLTAIYENWSTNPETVAEIADELVFDALTTPGVTAADGTVKKVQFDLSTSRRRFCFYSVTNLGSPYMYISDDGVNWEAVTQVSSHTMGFAGKFRYLKLTNTGNAQTINYMKIRCYNLN